MGLTTIFGINGVGKDSVAEGIRKRNPQTKVTSMSRLLMYALGISKTCDVREKITEEQYKILEETPQSVIADIENNEYKHLLERMANSDEKVICLAHLVSALRFGNETKYLTDKITPEWFVDISDDLIQLVAPVELISERRKCDMSRKRETNFAQILEHQELCSQEWRRIEIFHPDKIERMHIIQNIELQKAIDELEKIVYAPKREPQKLQQRHNFREGLKYYSRDEHRNNPLVNGMMTLNDNIELTKKEGKDNGCSK